MTIEIDGRRCLGSGEAGARLETHPALLARQAAQGKVKVYKFRGRLYYDAVEIEALEKAKNKEARTIVQASS